MKRKIMAAITPQQFDDMPHTRWVSLPKRTELKIRGNIVAIKIGAECSATISKTTREAQGLFNTLLAEYK